MNTVRKVYESDSSGNVHVDVPVGAPHRMVQVVVSWEDASVEASGWPPGWFDKTFGSIEDPTFERAPQGEAETREDL